MGSGVRTVAIDFDGVIHGYSKGWHDGTIYDSPIAGAIEGIKQLQKKYAVYVFTSREIEQVLPWLELHGLNCALDGHPYVEFWNHHDQVLVTNRKVPAFAYVDDRAVVFTSWAQLPNQLAGAINGNFGPPCCNLHGRRCEQGGEECCQYCTESNHFSHGGNLCSSPNLSLEIPIVDITPDPNMSKREKW